MNSPPGIDTISGQASHARDALATGGGAASADRAGAHGKAAAAAHVAITILCAACFTRFLHRHLDTATSEVLHVPVRSAHGRLVGRIRMASGC
jgi:hypothetical protein